MIESKFIVYQQSRLHYVKAGSGKEVIVFFHGFGQDHSIYLPLIQSLTPKYTLFVFDLYFHGKSSWAKGETPLEKEEWKRTAGLFLEDNQIDRFSVVGFSLGGKFSLATVEAFPARVNRLYLIAPDGIRTSFWYSMATYPMPLRKFFKGMIGNYNRFVALAGILHKMRLVDKGLVRFADFQMNTSEKRRRVYYSWVVFRHLRFDLKKLAATINQRKIDVTIIVGLYDKVIVPENMKKFRRYLDRCNFHVLESGHSGLIYQSLKFIQHDQDNTVNPEDLQNLKW